MVSQAGRLSTEGTRRDVELPKTTNRAEVVILIHGVGDPPLGSLHAQAAKRICALGIVGDNLVEANWNSQVAKPLHELSLNLDQLTGLMRGLIGSAWLGSVRPQTPAIATLVTVSTTLIHFLMLVGPLALLLLGLVLVLQWCPYHLYVSASEPWVASVCRLPLIPARLVLGEQVSPTLKWTLVFYGAIVLACCVMLTVTRLIASPRNGMSIALRQVLLFLLWPVIFTITCLIATPSLATGLLFSQILFFLYMSPTYDTVEVGVDLMLHVRSHSPWIQAASSGIAIVAVVLVARLVLRLAAPVLKVFADVACYMGDPAYESKIHKYIEAILQPYAGKDVIVVGHSLGSQIAVRALMSTRTRFASLGLVTMGSPIQRLLVRFFPGHVVAPDAAIQHLNKANSAFWWVNVYRPFDPIGSSIFQCPENRHRDVSTRQFLRIGVAAHTEYWNDQAVVDTVLAAMKGPAHA